MFRHRQRYIKIFIWLVVVTMVISFIAAFIPQFGR